MGIVGLFVVALPVASLVALDPGGWYPFGPAKWFAVSVVSAAGVAAVVWRGGLRLPRLATTLWLGLLGLLTAAAAVGLDPRLAWLGTAERHLGVAAWVLLASCTVVGASLTRAEVGWFVRGVVVATGLCGGYAAVELINGPPVRLDLDTERLGATFGSAAYLGAAMCLALPACVGVILDRAESRHWRMTAAVASVVGTIGIAGSGARGAWIGLLVAVLVAAVRTRRRWTMPSRRALVGVGIGVIAVVALVGPRVGDVVGRDAGAFSRLDEWSVAAETIAARPLLGAGPEGYRLVVGASIDADYEQRYGRATSPDRAHSAPLDVAAIAGIPAAVLYVALLVAGLLVAWRAMEGERPLFGGLAVGVVAYALQQIWLFPIAEIDPLFWLASGALSTAVGGRAWRPIAPCSPTPRRGVAVVAGLGVIVLFVTGLTGVAADRLARRAAESSDRSTALDAVERSTGLRPDMIRNHLLQADLEASSGSLGGIDAAIASTGRAATWSPRDPIVRRQEAALRTERAEITGVAEDASRAVAAWDEVLAHDPNCAPCLIGLGSAAVLGGDVEVARDAWRRADQLTDDPLPAQLLERLDAVTEP